MQPLLLRKNILALFCVTCFSLPVLSAEEPDPGRLAAPNWDRQLALELAATVNIQAEAEHLLVLASGDDRAAAISALHQAAARQGWPQPAREAVLFEFAGRLRQLEPFSVDAEVVEFLLKFSSQTWVAHEESFTTGVPLFPIRATAAGLVNQWTRQRAAFDAVLLLRQEPAELLSRYAANADTNIRAGIEMAVKNAPPDTLRILLRLGLPLLPDYPDLTGLLGIAAVAAQDVQSVSEVFIAGHGHAVVELGRQARQRFTAAQLGGVLLAVSQAAPPSTAAVIIAELAPDCIQLEPVANALMQWLDDPELGSTVALALARSGSSQQLETLVQRMALSPSSLTAKRIQTALSLQPGADHGGGQQ